MNLSFQRIQSGSHRHLEVLLPLYVDSFPVEERRTTSDLQRMLNVQEMYFSSILLDEALVGLVVYWKFEGFLYLEHLAISKTHRRKGFGAAVLNELQKMGNPILLEVEIPYDDASNKRVDFYQSHGFLALPVYYNQPPYRKGESVVPMMLFSDKTNWDTETLRIATELFQDRVYYQGNRG
jgi:GNAT superfamily N-acetyltransferase